MKTVFLFVLIFCISVLGAVAQVSHVRMPRSREASIATVGDFRLVAPPAFPKSAVVGSKSGLVPFAKVLPVSMDFMDGSRVDSIDGGLIFRMGITSPGAYSIGLYIGGLELVPGSELYVYGYDDRFAVGAVDAREVAADSSLRIAQIPGDSITVELYVPYGVSQKSFVVNKLYYDFKDFFSDVHTLRKAGFSSGICSNEVDVNCYQGDDYQAVKHAVLKYSFEVDGFLSYCTGTLVNSLRSDSLPLVLTAAHCICSEAESRTAIFYFNYENSSCGGSLQNYQTMSGASLVATSVRQPYYTKYGTLSSQYYPARDFTLLCLQRDIPANYEPYFAGISLDTVHNINSVACIHHPNGKAKKISASFQMPYMDNYPNDDDVDNNFLAFNHWHIPEWSYGTTEGGSSGSPLLNQNKSVIGILTGGYASCSSPRNDFFQMVSKAWDCSAFPDNQLKYWLSPGFDAMEVPPFDPYGISSKVPKSYIRATINSDTTQVNLQWQMMLNPGFLCDFNDMALSQDIADVFHLNRDGDRNGLCWELLTGDQAHDGGQCAVSYTSASGKTNDYLVLPKIQVGDGMTLSFWARSDGGTSQVNVGYSSSAQRFVTFETMEVGEEWTFFSVDLSAFVGNSVHLSISNVTTAGDSGMLLIDEVKLDSEWKSYEGHQFSMYRLYCNGKVVREFHDIDECSCDFDISRDGTYQFYVLNLYGDIVSEMGNAAYVDPQGDLVRTVVSDMEHALPAAALLVYPNPARESFAMELDRDLANVRLDVVDASGRICKSEYIGDVQSAVTYRISVSDLSSGTYIIKVYSGKDIPSASARFVVY